MSKYIDAEKLIAEVRRYKNKADERLKIKGRTFGEEQKDVALQNLCGNLLHFIDSLQQEQSTNTDNLCSELANFLIKNDIQEDKARFIANRIADIYGSKRYVDGLCDGLDTNEQEQPNAPKGKFNFPKFLYARTLDNKTIDISYAPQNMDAIEYVRNDFVEQEQQEKSTKKNCNNCPHCIDRKDQIGWHFRGCFGGQYKGKPIAEIEECPLQQERPEVDLEKEIDKWLDAEPRTVRDTARHFYELGLNARKEE